MEVHRPVTRGGEASPRKIFAPQEKCVGRILKLLHILLRFVPFLELFAPPLVSQAGYGPGSAANV